MPNGELDPDELAEEFLAERWKDGDPEPGLGLEERVDRLAAMVRALGFATHPDPENWYNADYS